MALKDFEAFIREKLLEWDGTVDVSPGSPIDTQLIQPLLARIGTDPFSSNLPLFMRDRIAQEFPELAQNDGDPLLDMTKIFEMLLDPLSREINRIALCQSLRDPNLLNTDEAEALGANLFASRNKGDTARVIVRLYFSTPRSKTINPSDYAVSKSGLLFYPTSQQSIKDTEMLLNQEGSYYYFDVSAQAEGPGDQYNVGPDEINNMPTVTDVVRATNKSRADSGMPAETAAQFIGRAEQDLSEKSLNTIRGIVSKLSSSFPEISRIAVVGFQDPEMGRDVVKGGGVGPILKQGRFANAAPDGFNGTTTTRVTVADYGVNFQYDIAAAGIDVSGFVLTLIDAFGPLTDPIQDLPVAKVINTNTLELDSSAKIKTSAYSCKWALRKRSITISDIPGGILFPDSPTGTITVADDSAHIGGCTDIYIKGGSFDQRSFILDDISDSRPALSGIAAKIVAGTNTLALAEYSCNPADVDKIPFSVLENDPMYKLLQDCIANGYVLDILYPDDAIGNYRILRATYGVNSTYPNCPVLELEPVTAGDLVSIAGNPDVTWKIQDDLDIELTEPKEQRWEGRDGRTYIGTSIFDTSSSTNMSVRGVAKGDVLRLLDGNDKGDHVVDSLGGPFNDRIVIEDSFVSSGTGLRFIVFRANKAGGMQMPLVRITSIDLLDSTSQPIGAQIPFGAPVYCLSEKFVHPGNGTKVEVWDACLGIVGCPLPDGLCPLVENRILVINWMTRGTLTHLAEWDSVIVNFAGVTTLRGVVDRINAVLHARSLPNAAYIVDGNRLGIAPIAPYTWVGANGAGPYGAAYNVLFGPFTTIRWITPLTSRDVRSDFINKRYDYGWKDPAIDYDVKVDGLDINTGTQVGHYLSLRSPWNMMTEAPHYADILYGRLLLDHDFNPEAGIYARLGARSIGYARLYFLDPLTVEFGTESRFTTVLSSGASLDFMPDPLADARRIPAYPETAEVKDGYLWDFDLVNKTFQISSGAPPAVPGAHFLDSGIRPGDVLVITYETFYGTECLAETPNSLIGTWIRLSVDNSADQVITFKADTGTSMLQRQSVADQINSAVGSNVAVINEANQLAFEADAPIILRPYGSANPLLGFSASADTTNLSPSAGRYLIVQVTSDPVTGYEGVKVKPTDTDAAMVVVDPPHNQYQHFSVYRPGTQRISATEMANNVAETGLYYFDISLASYGVGDLWNIDDQSEMKVKGFFGYGYSLHTDDPDKTFSSVEQPWLSLPASYFQVGTDDDLSNAVNLVGQNLQVGYDSSALVESVQNYMMSETERVTCFSPLVRHLVPYFTRVEVDYDGGSKASIIQPDIESYIKLLYPSQSLQSSMVQKYVTNRGATSVTNPVTVMAVIHNTDRSVWMEWSQDKINSGRLAAFIPDVTKLTQRTA